MSEELAVVACAPVSSVWCGVASDPLVRLHEFASLMFVTLLLLLYFRLQNGWMNKWCCCLCVNACWSIGHNFSTQEAFVTWAATYNTTAIPKTSFKVLIRAIQSFKTAWHFWNRSATEKSQESSSQVQKLKFLKSYRTKNRFCIGYVRPVSFPWWRPHRPRVSLDPALLQRMKRWEKTDFTPEIHLQHRRNGFTEKR